MIQHNEGFVSSFILLGTPKYLHLHTYSFLCCPTEEVDCFYLSLLTELVQRLRSHMSDRWWTAASFFRLVVKWGVCLWVMSVACSAFSDMVCAQEICKNHSWHRVFTQGSLTFSLSLSHTWMPGFETDVAKQAAVQKTPQAAQKWPFNHTPLLQAKQETRNNFCQASYIVQPEFCHQTDMDRLWETGHQCMPKLYLFIIFAKAK